jgi:glycosyltransferase involved in cell wall biosynthesis
VLDPCGPEDIVTVASRYDVGIVALRGTNENERHATSAKLCTYMASGLAVIASDLPGIARVVSEAGNGLLVDDMRPESWATAIDQLASMNTDLVDAMRRRSLEEASRRSRSIQMPAFVDEFVRAVS